jgi:hypothetical protein
MASYDGTTVTMAKQGCVEAANGHGGVSYEDSRPRLRCRGLLYVVEEDVQIRRIHTKFSSTHCHWQPLLTIMGRDRRCVRLVVVFLPF